MLYGLILMDMTIYEFEFIYLIQRSLYFSDIFLFTCTVRVWSIRNKLGTEEFKMPMRNIKHSTYHYYRHLVTRTKMHDKPETHIYEKSWPTMQKWCWKGPQTRGSFYHDWVLCWWVYSFLTASRFNSSLRCCPSSQCAWSSIWSINRIFKVL